MPRRVLSGVVVSASGEKTVIVRVERRVIHPLYKKYIRQAKRYAVHDEINTLEVGDKIEIIECAPISKTKRWAAKSVWDQRYNAFRPHPLPEPDPMPSPPPKPAEREKQTPGSAKQRRKAS